MSSSNEEANLEIKRLVVVSNRLPIVLAKEGEDKWRIRSGSGGLVTALAPVLKDRGGLWIGWPGIVGELDIRKPISFETKDFGYTLIPVLMTQSELDSYYCGFSNMIIWPLFHDLLTLCQFNQRFWDVYQQVNKKFALTIYKNIKKEDFIWVHDYHLMLVAKELRALGITNKIGFFLHIPFPQLDIFLKLPWRFQILKALLDYDLIGFQTLRDKRNFIQCIRELVRRIKIEGKGQVQKIANLEREIRVGDFPISIDYNDFVKRASSKEVSDEAWYIHENLPNRQIILGIDRLDYTKGILHKLEAFRNALLRYPELKGKISLVQVIVPSRRVISRYNDLKKEIERLIGEINGQFTRSGWMPIYYLFRELTKIELLAYYRTAEIALITPLKDGMNLVAKEYCACSLEEVSVLILSEFAGAAAQLYRGAVLVNPFDMDGVADAIYRAFKMTKEERRSRMRRLRRSIQKYNVFWWVDSFLHSAITKKLDSFPIYNYYIPQMEIFKEFEKKGSGAFFI